MNSPALASPPDSAVLQLAVIVPTFNERDNVAELVRRLHAALTGISWEVIFVDDDSPDGTAQAAFDLAAADGRVRCVQRLGRRGLSSACVEGMLATGAPYLAVIDGDLQHDECCLPRMLTTLQTTPDLDLVIGSRYVDKGDVGDWNPLRLRISRLATRLGRRFVPETLRDPMSGFFMIRRQVFLGLVRRLSSIGFKILLDIFASAPVPLKFRELPYQFRNRQAGESKLDSQAGWDYGMLLLDKAARGYVPVRFLAFSIVGGVGIGVHFLALVALYMGLKMEFLSAQVTATMCAMTFNYAVNNALTYRDMRLRGLAWMRGWLTFVLVCGVGAIANVGIAAWMYSHHYEWVAAAIAGTLVGSVWNYAVTRSYTWGTPKSR